MNNSLLATFSEKTGKEFKNTKELMDWIIFGNEYD